MKTETDNFVEASARLVLNPRYVVALSFDDANTDITYLTSHSDALDPGSVAAIDRIDGCIKSISGQSQKISPDKAQHTIGNVTFTILDVNQELSTKINAKLSSGEGLRKKRIILYKGHDELTAWSDYSKRLTYLVDDISYKDGVYTLICSDIQRYEKEKIFQPDQGVLTSTITASATTIPVTISSGASRFNLVAHDSVYSANPSDSVGYIQIEDEIICHDGWTDGTYTALNVIERGALNTTAIAHTVTESEDEQKKKVDEYFYLEMPAPKMIYALLTGVLHGQGASLPSHWNLGINTDYVRLTDFTGIGDDIWDTSTNTGRLARFIGLESSDAKKFIEEELLLWLGCFMPVYSDGAIGLKSFEAILPYSAYDDQVTTNDIISYSALKYDQKAVINNIVIKWNWIDSIDRFTKISQLIDSDSISKYGKSEKREFEFKGVFTGVHSDSDIRNYFTELRNRYSAPPLRLQVTVKPEWDRLEVGDTIRLTCGNIWDVYAASSVDRVFEIQQVKTDWISGRVTLDLFGGVEAVSESSISSTDVMQDSYYTSTGTELSTVLTIAGGAVTTSGSLTGSASNSSGVFYYDGDLTINAGVTVSISRNVLLKVKGFLTINGDLVCTGNTTDQGIIGITTSGQGAYARIIVGPQSGTENSGSVRRGTNANISIGFFRENRVWNVLNPDGASLTGVPTSLLGVYGATGASGAIAGFTGATPVYAARTAAGGAGGASGGGLVVVSRGAAFGGSGGITLDGGDGSEGSTATGNDTPLITVYGQSGAGGYPGAVLFLIDGDYSAPTLSSTNISALKGTQPVPAGIDKFPDSVILPGEQAYGQVITDTFNYWQSQTRIQYIPEAIASFDNLPADEEQKVTGYENKPTSWTEVLDDGSKPDDNANLVTATSQLSDDASLGDTALGSGITGTITGNTLQTSSSGQRIDINASGDELRFYDSGNDEVATIGISSGEGVDNVILQLGGQTAGNGDEYNCIEAVSDSLNTIFARQRSNGGRAIAGWANTANGVGVEGVALAAAGVGVLAQATNSSGLPLRIMPNIGSSTPTGQTGAIYVPADQNTFKIYLDSAWRDIAVVRAYDNSGSAKYIQLSNGLQLCYGTGSSSSDTAITVTFANSFTASPWVFVSRLQANATSTLEPATISTGSFTIDREGGIDGSMTYYYFAIGYRNV